MRVLLIEDSRRLQESLSLGLRGAGWTVDVAGDGESGLHRARERNCDVLILDLMLPRLPGMDVLAALRAEGDPVRVLVLTARDTVADCVACLERGSDDYLVKPFAFDELLARLQVLTRRPERDARHVITAGPLRIDRIERKATWSGTELRLAPLQFEILALLGSRAGSLLSRAEIRQALYASDRIPGCNTVDSAVCALRQSLSVCGVPPLIRTVRRHGYVLEAHTG